LAGPSAVQVLEEEAQLPARVVVLELLLPLQGAEVYKKASLT
jgi:hypothetical protein